MIHSQIHYRYEPSDCEGTLEMVDSCGGFTEYVCQECGEKVCIIAKQPNTAWKDRKDIGGELGGDSIPF